MTSLVGNEAPRAAFAAALAAGSVHHAWLIAGPAGVGKGLFARAAALQLLGDTPQAAAYVAARTHPDYLLVEREVWTTGSSPRIVPLDERKEDEPPARSIRVEQVRTLREKLAGAPVLSPRRAVVIDAVDDLEKGGANALLKSLEEPPAGTVFLLVSHAPGKLLPTIRSRCRLLRFAALSEAETAAVLRDALPEAGEVEIAALVAAGEGAPGRALRFAGLDVAAIDGALAAIAADGDADNARRAALAKTLAGKAAQPRYEAFLERAPALVARLARERRGPALAAALDAQAATRDLAEAAAGLSLDQQATVWEMAGLVAALGR